MSKQSEFPLAPFTGVIATDWRPNQLSKDDESNISPSSTSLENLANTPRELKTMDLEEYRRVKMKEIECNFNKKYEERQKRHEALLYLMKLEETKDDEPNQKKREQDEKRRLEDLAKHEKEIEEAERMALIQEKKSRAQEWENGHRVTQMIQKMRRKYGFGEGINPPPPLKKIHQIETETKVILIKRQNSYDVDGTSHQEHGKPFFTVDLKLFRNARSIKGDSILPEGAKELGRQLKNKVCPRLERLDLGWNHIRLSGMSSLMDAFLEIASKNVSNLLHLDLRSNHIPPDGVLSFRKALEGGAFPSLQSLDIRLNYIGDKGAKEFVHCVLRGLLTNLQYLNVSSCHIRNSGIKALFSCFTCDKIELCLMPKVEAIIARDNRPTPGYLKKFGPWPTYLQV